jgi:hypothetical protein
MSLVGDLHQHPLAGQSVPDEDHPAVMAGDAVATVGDRTDLDRPNDIH